ncbi:MAG: hypothetical protein J0M08_01275 [Bacteroidetes bacterium]|nr:hypothetical protein [Bacteroidota bacterium]
MKKHILTFVAILGAIVLFDSCKKGENDPFLSLRSRKARVAGEWKLTSGEMNITSDDGTSSMTADGSTRTYTDNSGFSSSEVFTLVYTFEKDGTFKSTEVSGTGSSATTVVREGTWNFTAGVGKEVKRKEQIVLITLTKTTTTSSSSSTVTYTGGDAPTDYWMLDELRNKKMVALLDGTSTIIKPTMLADNYTTTGNLTFEQ